MFLSNNFFHRSLIFLFFINIGLYAQAQNTTGQVIDGGGKPLPFATIKFGDTKEGVIANLEGKFSIEKSVKFIEVSHTGYVTQKLKILNDRKLIITLEASTANLQPVVIVRSTGNKLKRILNTAIANRNTHNPDKYDWYQCNVYYKMLVDVKVSDSFHAKDSKLNERMHDTLRRPYIMLTETYSKRTWQRPANLQEQIIASRMSGFTKPIFSVLITDVLPFHAYNEFIDLNGKDFYSPLSKGLYQRFHFKLLDEIVQQKDTIWVISFQPKLDPVDLGGTLYITSDGFALTHIIAHSIDAVSKKDMGIEQEYAKQDGRWFPKQLNYILEWQIGKEDSIVATVKGTSVIDSITFKENKKFKFDKAHTVQLLENAGERRDSIWAKYRPAELTYKERRTYKVIDSVFKKDKIEDLVFHTSKLAEGKLSAGKFDINLNRIYSYNAFEQNRIGWGMQTNDNISKKFSIGGWTAYGTKDKQWKYGGFAELYADRFKEFTIGASYYKDIRDPGRLQVHKEIDNNTLRMFVINRADKVEGWNVSVQKKFGYLTMQAVAGKENIQPQYDYIFSNSNKFYTSFSVNEISLNLRYAFGETSSPFFEKYYSNGTKYPVLYGRIITGKITNADINYTQIIAAANWAKNINRFGKEKFLLLTGISLSKDALPLNKLFAGNGFLAQGTSLYGFGAMETMLPYQFYTDKFINFYWLHQFNRPLFHAQISEGFTIAPKPAIAYNVLYGTLTDPSVHHNVLFSVPDKGYHEAGLMLNNVLRIKLLGLYYATLNVGYFHNIPTANSYPNQGRVVYGVGVEL